MKIVEEKRTNYFLGRDDFNFSCKILSALNMGSWMIVRWLLVSFKLHGDASYTPHVPIDRRDPLNRAKLQHKSAIIIAFFNQVYRNINSFFMNDC